LIIGIINVFEKSNRGMLVPIDATIKDTSIQISIKNTPDASDATLYMIFFNKEHNVTIGLQMEFPTAEMKRQGYDGCALILQKNDSAGNPSAIIGATVIKGL